MSARVPRREDDLRTLEILQVIEVAGTGAAMAGFGLSNSAVQGMRGRMLSPKAVGPCACTKPENRDGGMPAGWWRG
jgi:hypothetical protein